MIEFDLVAFFKYRIVFFKQCSIDYVLINIRLIGPRLSTNKIFLSHFVSFCPNHFSFFKYRQFLLQCPCSRQTKHENSLDLPLMSSTRVLSSPSTLLHPVHPVFPKNSSSAPSTSVHWRRHQAIQSLSNTAMCLQKHHTSLATNTIISGPNLYHPP